MMKTKQPKPTPTDYSGTWGKPPEEPPPHTGEFAVGWGEDVGAPYDNKGGGLFDTPTDPKKAPPAPVQAPAAQQWVAQATPAQQWKEQPLAVENMSADQQALFIQMNGWGALPSTPSDATIDAYAKLVTKTKAPAADLPWAKDRVRQKAVASSAGFWSSVSSFLTGGEDRRRAFEIAGSDDLLGQIIDTVGTVVAGPADVPLPPSYDPSLFGQAMAAVGPAVNASVATMNQLATQMATTPTPTPGINPGAGAHVAAIDPALVAQLQQQAAPFLQQATQTATPFFQQAAQQGVAPVLNKIEEDAGRHQARGAIDEVKQEAANLWRPWYVKTIAGIAALSVAAAGVVLVTKGFKK